MSCIFVTGSTDGLGRAAAETLMDAGHRVILHARSKERAAVLASITGNLADIVIGDLSSAGQPVQSPIRSTLSAVLMR